MNVKIDTKERFTVITPQESHLSVNMTEELTLLLREYLQKDIPHIVLNITPVQRIHESVALTLANIQREFYEKNCSFVICCLQPVVKQLFDKDERLDGMNITASESEAWDIVQMEEIERELLGGE